MITYSLTKQVRAKAVLERDLRELRARRKALDNLVVEEYPESLPISAADVQNTPESHTSTDLETKPVLENESKDEDMNEDIATVDTGTSHPTVKDNSVLLLPQHEIETDTHGSLETSMQQVKTEGPTILDSAQQANQDLSNKSTITGLSLDLSLAVSSAASEAPLTSGLQSSTLGSMFDSGNHGDSNLNFDFDFTTDGPGSQSLDFGGNNGDLDLSSFGGQANSNQENIDTMLPDLDGYGNSGSSDINILDLSNSTSNQNGDQGGDSNADDLGMSGDLDITMGMEADESNFDQMVSAMEFSDTADEGGQFDTYFAFNDI